MRWFLAILLAVPATLIGLAALALTILLQTDLGLQLADRISRPIVEDLVEQQLGSEIRYDRLEGNLPGQLVIRDLELSANGEVWARADRFALRWEPMDLLGGEVHIRSAVLNEGALLRVPELPSGGEPKPEVDEESQGGGLPDIRVDEVVIDDFFLGEPVLGEAYTFSVQGDGRYLDPRLRLNLRGRTQERTDELVISASYDGRGVDVDAAVISEDGGAISRALSTGGRTELRIGAVGPLEGLKAEIAAAAGQYGDLQGSVAGSVDDLNVFDVDLAYAPGSFLPPEAAKALGEEVTLDARVSYLESDVTLAIESLTGAFGEIGGRIAAALGEQRSASADIDGRLSREVLAGYGAEALAGAFSLDAEASEDGEGYGVNGTLEAGGASVTVRGGQVTDAVPFSGQVSASATGLEFGGEPIAPMLREGVRAKGTVRYASDGEITVRGLDAAIGGGNTGRVTVRGDARYGLESGELSADAGLTAGPIALARLAGRGSFDGPLSLTAKASGTIEAFSLDASAALPGGSLDDRSFGPGQLTADLSGLPNGPSGSVRLTSDDGAYEGSAVFDLAGDLLSVKTLTVEAGGLTLNGEGTVNVETQAADITLSMDAGEETQLITGQTVGGSLLLNAEIGAGTGPVNATLTAQNLRFEANEVGNLRLTAQGPREAIDYNLQTTNVTAASLFLTELDSTGILRLGEEPEVRIQDFLAALPGGEEQRVTLAAPTTLSFGDGIELAPTRISWLENGTITASASIGGERWVADIEAQEIPVPKADGLAALSLDLDTAEAVPARFELTVSGQADDTSYDLRSDGTWNGERVRADMRLVRGGSDELGTVDASVPLRLTREPSLGVELLEEGLDVQVSYDDRIEALYAFLPLESQPVAGNLRADVSITGNPRLPQTDGTVEIDNARFEDSEIGITLTNLRGGVAFNVTESGTRAEVDIVGSGALERQDSVRLTGTFNTTEEASNVDLQLNLDEAQVARSPELELRVTTDLDLTGSLTELTLAGPIRIDELDFSIPTSGGDGAAPDFVPVNVVRTDGPQTDRAEEVETPEESPLTINLDLSVRAQNGVFIRGRGLTSEWKADLEIEGTVNDPEIVGSVGLVDGELNLGGRTFDVTQGQITFIGGGEVNPRLDIRAETEAGQGQDAVTAIVNVTGRADDPDIGFSSNPALPEDEVLALILFGRRPPLSTTEALQLAQAAATLSGTGPFGGGGSSIRTSLGLDRLSFDTAERSLTVGKYISDDIYVSARQGLGDVGTAISVIYEVSRFFSLETTLEPSGAQELSANYKRDY